jgi:hypothetical protein
LSIQVAHAFRQRYVNAAREGIDLRADIHGQWDQQFALRGIDLQKRCPCHLFTGKLNVADGTKKDWNFSQ